MRPKHFVASIGAVAFGFLTVTAQAAPAQFGAVEKPAPTHNNHLTLIHGHGGGGGHFGGGHSHGFHHFHGAGIFWGAPYYGYSDCWWSRRYHRRVCPWY